MIYSRIKELRKEKDISQRELSEALQMHKTTYARYETGERDIPLSVAAALAEYYNVSLDYLAGLTNNKKRK